MIHWSNFRKSMTDHDPFSKKVFLARDFGKVWKTKIEFHKPIQKSISKIRGGKHPCKKPSQSIGQQRIQPTKKLSQKAKPSPSKNRFKFQNNNPKNGASARGASVVVLKFVSIFCWTWLGLLAELFLAGFLPLFF